MMKCYRFIHLCMAFIAVQVLLLVMLARRGRMLVAGEGEGEARSASTRHLLDHSPSTVDLSRLTPTSYDGWRTYGCSAGHIWHLQAMCQSTECLQRVDQKTGLLSFLGLETKKHVRRNVNVIPDEITEELSYLRGIYHRHNAQVVTAITDIQWLYKVYGSLLQFGVGEGKLSSVLAYNVDHDMGEKLVFSDSFNNPTFNSEKGDQIETFLKTMRNRNLTFSEKAHRGQRQAFLHTSYPLDLKVEHLNSLRVPQFRMVFIHSYGDPVKLYMHLENAVCLIRDGGLIVVEDVNNPEVLDTVVSFLRSMQTTPLSPLLNVKNTLYLCTTNWQKKYLQLLLERGPQLDVDIHRSSKVKFNGESLLLEGR